jgi:hypothetical protein
VIERERRQLLMAMISPTMVARIGRRSIRQMGHGLVGSSRSATVDARLAGSRRGGGQPKRLLRKVAARSRLVLSVGRHPSCRRLKLLFRLSASSAETTGVYRYLLGVNRILI